MNQGLSGELYVALDQKYISDQQFHALFDQASRTRSRIGGLIKYLLSSKDNPRPRTRDESRRRPKAVTKDKATKDDLTSVSDDEGPRTR